MPTPSSPRFPKAGLATAAEPATAEIDDLLARVVLCRALRQGFERPNQELHGLFFSEPGRRALRRAARRLDAGAGAALGQALDLLYGRRRPPLGALQQQHDRIFGHTLRGNVCPYEVEYGRTQALQQAQELADLAGFYAAFGLRPAADRRERPDHVACELEFLEFLYRKEIWSIQLRDSEMRGTTQRAVRRFLRDHLARFGRAFGLELWREDPDGFFGHLGLLCEAFLAVECERLDLPLGPRFLELRSEDADIAPAACGPSEKLVRIGGGSDPEPWP